MNIIKRTKRIEPNSVELIIKNYLSAGEKMARIIIKEIQFLEKYKHHLEIMDTGFFCYLESRNLVGGQKL